MSYLIAAYAVIAVVILGYVFSLARRQDQVRKDIDILSRVMEDQER